MLENHERERLLDRMGMPNAGRRIVLDAAKFAPVRKVRSSGGKNVTTYYQSRKMQCAIGTESRHIEFPAAVSHEHAPEVLEYYPQPCRLQFEAIDVDGEIHKIDHTPDFLLIEERSVCLEERKDWRKLEGLAKKFPWRYQLGANGYWTAPLIENWLAERGIGYRIRTERDIPQRRIENLLLLQDFLQPAAPDCSEDIASRIRAALTEAPVLFLAELYEKCACTADDVYKLIADGLLVSDIDVEMLNEPYRCRVFRDASVRAFEYARRLPTSQILSGVVDICAGAHVLYGQKQYKVTLVGSTSAVLETDAGESVELGIETLKELAAKGNLKAPAGWVLPSAPARLCDLTKEQLEIAVCRLEALESVTAPNRTQRRHMNAVALARQAGTDELMALVPNFGGRGRRGSQLLPAQEAAIQEVIHKHYLNNKAANMKHVHVQLRVLCAEREISPPSYPTLITRIKAVTQAKSDLARFGSRIAYKNAEFVDVLYADTPVHGSRFMQYVHMDHTVLDIELVSQTTGASLGRPCLSLAIDAFTRRVVGIYLSYDPPSYRSNMMLVRDIVRRFNQLPQFIVVDNGADFRSNDFTHFLQLMGVHPRYRPKSQPRHGSVLERIFGHVHSAYVHNLAGNTKATKNVREITGKFLPSRLAEWCLEHMYRGLEYWAFTHYDTEVHSTLGVTPRDAYERSLLNSGERKHRVVTLSTDFRILSCPSVNRGGTRKVDRQRGIKVHNNFYYWCQEMRDPKVHGKSVAVRYDPWDSATVYVQINKRWVAAQCKALVGLGQLTEKERELVSNEMRRRFRIKVDEEPSPQKMAEFLRVFSPEGAASLDFERQKENKGLYQKLRLGAIREPVELPLLKHVPSPSLSDSKNSPAPTRIPSTLPSTLPVMPDDIEFDTF